MRSNQLLLLLLILFNIYTQILAKKETIYIPQPYQAYKLCVSQKCEKLFCVISDSNCQREIKRSEKCKQENLNCQGFFEWEMEVSENDNTPVPNTLRLCLQQCPADKFESENFYDIEDCVFRCAFTEYKKDL